MTFILAQVLDTTAEAGSQIFHTKKQTKYDALLMHISRDFRATSALHNMGSSHETFIILYN